MGPCQRAKWARAVLSRLFGRLFVRRRSPTTWARAADYQGRLLPKSLRRMLVWTKLPRSCPHTTVFTWPRGGVAYGMTGVWCSMRPQTPLCNTVAQIKRNEWYGGIKLLVWPTPKTQHLNPALQSCWKEKGRKKGNCKESRGALS